MDSAFIRFSGTRHPSELAEPEVTCFLSHLAVERRVSAVLSAREVVAVIGTMSWPGRLVAMLMYGSGLRLLETLTLRVKDLDFSGRQITVRRGKGGKDRITMLPDGLVGPLHRHLAAVRAVHQRDLARGLGRVALPEALTRKLPGAGRDWVWQYVFPPLGSTATRVVGNGGATTFMSPWSSVPCAKRSRGSGSRSGQPAIAFDTPLRRISSGTGMTSERFRSCLVTGT